MRTGCKHTQEDALDKEDAVDKELVWWTQENGDDEEETIWHKEGNENRTIKNFKIYKRFASSNRKKAN